MNDREQREIKKATESAVQARDRARSGAIKAVRLMISQLRECLAGDSLRGMPNLSSSRNPCRGMRVACKSLYEPLPRPKGDSDLGRSSLCLTHRARLEYLSLHSDGKWYATEVKDENIQAEWAEDVAETISAALRLHKDACEISCLRYEDIDALNQRIISALQG